MISHFSSFRWGMICIHLPFSTMSGQICPVEVLPHLQRGRTPTRPPSWS